MSGAGIVPAPGRFRDGRGVPMMWKLEPRRRVLIGPVVLAAILLSSVPASAAWPAPTSWWLNLRSTGYVYQTEEIADAPLDRFAAYQEFDGAVSGLANGKLAFRMGGRVADDLSLKRKVTDRSRLYVGHAEARIDPRLTARFGRQFVQEGPTGLTLDGLWLSTRPAAGWDAQIWGGARAPYDRRFAPGELGNDAAWGARVGTRPLPFARLAASWAYRERDGRVASRPAGLDGSIALPYGVRAVGRAVYDFERDMWEREDALVQWQLRPDLPVVTGQFIDRRPAIDAASYFARFGTVERVRQARGSVRYEHRTGFGLEAEVVGTFLDWRETSRIAGAVLLPVARVGYSVRTGDNTGEQNRFFGDGSVRVLPWLRLEAGGAVETYSFLDDPAESDEFDLTSAYARVRAFPRGGIGVTLEVQRLDNPLYEEDFRVLGGIDFSMGRGASRFGLGRGGWLR